VTPDRPPPHRIKFDATINLGHIITFVGFILAGFGAWATLDKRIVVLEERRHTQSAIDTAQDARALDSSNELKAVLLRLDRQVERLADRLDRTETRKVVP